MRILNESGVPRKAAVFVQNSPIFIGLNAASDGRFKAYAVPASEPIRLFVTSGNVEYVRQFPAATGPVDLGDVVLTTPNNNATLQVTLDQTNWQNSGDFYTIPGVSLIRDDASYLVSFNTNAAGQVVADFHGSESALPIPAGTYFLVPGTFLYRPEDLRAFDLVRTGQTALVPNWPTITVAPGGTATATVHAAELDAAIRATIPPE